VISFLKFATNFSLIRSVCARLARAVSTARGLRVLNWFRREAQPGKSGISWEMVPYTFQLDWYVEDTKISTSVLKVTVPRDPSTVVPPVKEGYPRCSSKAALTCGKDSHPCFVPVGDQ